MTSKFFKPLITWIILITLVLIPFFIYENDINEIINTLISNNNENLFALASILFLILASDIFLPIPSCLLSAMCGTFLGPYFGFAVSFAAMSASSFLGYFIGRFFNSLALKIIAQNSSKIKNLTNSNNSFMLFALRPVPVLAECSCVYAGLNNYPLKQSAFWMLLGNAVISFVYAIIGHLGRASDSFVPAFLAVVGLSTIGFICGKIATKSKK